MTKSEIIKKKIMYILKSNGRWMTASEIINWGSLNHMLEAKNLPDRKANSHPVYRILSGMIFPDEHNVYTYRLRRRVRKSGPEAGSYEYTIFGIFFRRIKLAIKAI